MNGTRYVCLLSAAWVAAFGPALRAAEDGEDYRKYARESQDFRRVALKKEALQPTGRWDHWVLMPWRFQWGRNYDDALAAELAQDGFNGGFCDHAPRADADLHEKYGFLWYLDHAAGKGFFELAAGGKENRAKPNRPVCLLDPAEQASRKERVRKALTRAETYRTRAAYALDDEVSWSSFTSPAKWDNCERSLADYTRWLQERYQTEAALRQQWTSGAPDGITALANWGRWPQSGGTTGFVKRMANPDDYLLLFKRPMDQWNLSACLDALSYMDSQFNNVVGEFVAYANSIDPETPCGFVGGGNAAAYGGYDYAKLTRKIQFLEAYDIGGSMEIGRSLFPGNLVPTVRTGFGDPAAKEGVWFNWYYMVHGDRGVIAWAANWFTDKMPAARVKGVGAGVPRLSDCSRKIYGGTWMHDGVALYYSHPSIQMSWFIDIETHGTSWINRGSSLNNNLSSAGGTAWAWQKYLEDAGLQYNWFSYADLLEKGIDPKEYKVLILPRTLCLSKDEAAEIRRYVEAGGVVIGDHQTGLFDQHGKAWPGGGALDALFGVEKRPVCKRGSLFFGECLGEKNDEANAYGNFLSAGRKTWDKCLRAKGLVVAQRDMPTFVRKTTGKGWACHMNVSMMEYPLLRVKGTAEAARYGAPVTELLAEAGVKPWVKLSVAGKTPDITEATYWRKDGRVVVCVVKNPLKFASEFGDTKTEGIVKEIRELTVTFAERKDRVVDETSGRELGSGSSFTIPWKMDEAAMISFAVGGAPARKDTAP
jgi:hypothetical protein